MSYKSFAVIALLSATVLAAPVEQFGQRADVMVSEGRSSLAARSYDPYEIPSVFARADKHTQYQNQVRELDSLYHQWCHAFDDATAAVSAASREMDVQKQLRMTNSPHFSQAAYNAAYARFQQATANQAHAQQMCARYRSQLQALKPPRARRSIDFEGLDGLD